MAATVLIAFLAGCASRPAAPPDTDEREPAGFPGAYYRELLALGKPVFRVDPAGSIVVIEVRRGGTFPQFGHDHVVASHDVAGRVAPDEGRADLWVPLDALVVDEPDLRAEAGFQTQPSPDDIAGTRRNMVTRVLETDRHPHMLIAVSRLGAGAGALQLRVDVTLRGVTRSVQTAVQFEPGAEELSVSGAIAVEQTDFGIVPLSILGGAIAVQDRLNVVFRIRARRIG